MKLRLRIGRQRAQSFGTDEMRNGSEHADGADRAVTPPPVPLPRTPERRVVRAGSYCRASEVGQTAVTEAGRAVLAISTGRCGRWVHDDPSA